MNFYFSIIIHPVNKSKKMEPNSETKTIDIPQSRYMPRYCATEICKRTHEFHVHCWHPNCDYTYEDSENNGSMNVSLHYHCNYVNCNITTHHRHCDTENCTIDKIHYHCSLCPKIVYETDHHWHCGVENCEKSKDQPHNHDDQIIEDRARSGCNIM